MSTRTDARVGARATRQSKTRSAKVQAEHLAAHVEPAPEHQQAGDHTQRVGEMKQAFDLTFVPGATVTSPATSFSARSGFDASPVAGRFSYPARGTTSTTTRCLGSPPGRWC
jgi:hypothetical protein